MRQEYVRKELFTDDIQIEAVENLDRRLNQPTLATENPILEPDNPWEGWMTSPRSWIYVNARASSSFSLILHNLK